MECVRICGVDCHQGDENCNGYCIGKAPIAKTYPRPDPAKATGVSRLVENERAVLVMLDNAPSDEDLRRIHEALR